MTFEQRTVITAEAMKHDDLGAHWAGVIERALGQLPESPDAVIVVLGYRDAVETRVYHGFDERYPLGKILRGIGRIVRQRVMGMPT